MMLASVDDDDDGDDDDDDDSVCASGCVCVCAPCTVMNNPSPDGWLSKRQSVQTLSASVRLRRPASVSPPRSSSAEKGDRSRNDFNISTADSRDLIVVPVKQIQHFERGD